jgi:hypothetical protein
MLAGNIREARFFDDVGFAGRCFQQLQTASPDHRFELNKHGLPPPFCVTNLNSI